MSTILEAVPEGEPVLPDLRSRFLPLLQQLDGRRTLEDAAGVAGLDELEATRIACAMLFPGIVRGKEVVADGAWTGGTRC